MNWNWLRWGLVGVGIVFVVGVAALNLVGLSPLSRPITPVAQELTYVIPRGTITNIGLGAASSVLPNQVELTVGEQDTLIIKNEDLYPFDVGGMVLHPGQSYRQQFTRPGTYDLACSVHSADRIRVIVHPAGED